MPVSQWGRILVDEIEGSNVPPGQLWLWPLGGASLAARSSNATIYIDLYTGAPSEGIWIRIVAVPLDPADLRQVDAVFSTHDHDDHCHRETLLAIAEKTKARFVGPKSSVARMLSFGLPPNHVIQAKQGDRFTFGNMTVTAAEIIDHADPTSLGWVVSVADGPTLFDGGDSMYGEYFKEIGRRHRITAATLSVAGPLADGRKIYLDAREIVQAAIDLRVGLLIPKHWDLWRNVAMDPHEVLLAAQAMRVHLGIRIPRLGEVIKLTV